MRHNQYYRYRTTYRRRRRFDFSTFFRILVIGVLIGIFAFFAVAVYRAFRSGAVMEQLKAENATLRQTLSRYQAAVPDPQLVEQVNQQPLAYQTMYPEMRVEPVPTVGSASKDAVYLTFEGGPSANTVKILDVLKKTGQKATFFVVGRNITGNEAVLKRMVQEGHTIGVLSYAQDYNAMYASVEAYLEDFYQTYQAIYQACGVHPTIFRFPGSSLNSYSMQIYEQTIAEMLRRGFLYYDWSVSAGDDTSARRTITQITQTVLQGIRKTEATPIVRLHDGADHGDTAYAFANLVSELSKAGYACAPLTNKVRPVTFAYVS